MSKIKVAPGAGRRVQLPGGKWVPAEGTMVDRDTFVERRLLDGDLLLVPTPPAPAAPATQPNPPPAAAGTQTAKEG